MIKIDKEYLRRGTFISFLWKPRVFFGGLKDKAPIVYPLILILIGYLLSDGLTLLAGGELREQIFFNAPMVFNKTIIFQKPIDIIMHRIISVPSFVFLSFIFFYLFYLIARNRQYFKLVLSIIIHAYLAAIYGVLIVGLVNAIYYSLGGVQISSFLHKIPLLVYFIYLALGLNWGIEGTKGQLVTGYILYIIYFFIVKVLALSILIYIFMFFYKMLFTLTRAFFEFIFWILSDLFT